jgi:Ca2+-transporting ATPase
VTSGRGLSASEAAARRAQYGASELLVRGGRTLWSMIGEQFGDVVICALLAATIVSALSGGYLDAAVIVTIVLLNAGMGLVQERKAEQSLAALQRIAAPHAHMLRAGAAE